MDKDKQIHEILDFWRSSPDQMPRNADVLIIEAKLDIEYLAGLVLMSPAAINVSGDASSSRAGHHGDAEAIDAL